MLRQQISSRLRGCWRLPSGGGGTDTPAVTLGWRLEARRQRRRRPAGRAAAWDALFRIAAEAAVRAVRECWPFALPPTSTRPGGRHWEFDPSQMIVGVSPCRATCAARMRHRHATNCDARRMMRPDQTACRAATGRTPASGRAGSVRRLVCALRLAALRRARPGSAPARARRRAAGHPARGHDRADPDRHSRVPAARTGAFALEVTGVISADLERSGLFRPLDPASFIDRPRDLNTAAALPGLARDRRAGARRRPRRRAPRTGATSPSSASTTCSRRASSPASASSPTRSEWRRLAHRVADQVYERLTGEKGYFDTQIVFIDETGPKDRRAKRLAIMDQDGANVRLLSQGASWC